MKEGTGSVSTPNTPKVRIAFDQRVPVRDGITLSADIYHPVDPAGEAENIPGYLDPHTVPESRHSHA